MHWHWADVEVGVVQRPIVAGVVGVSAFRIMKAGDVKGDASKKRER